ncbi:hypothetical protein ACFPM0_29890 [Pseudonocardia sulfidoxydans]|uniref:hypothetical protein n=1 Tax=Pseudonocardia sulfidoxydans TaxID=54011 RepID=UPI00360BC91A
MPEGSSRTRLRTLGRPVGAGDPAGVLRSTDGARASRTGQPVSGNSRYSDYCRSRVLAEGIPEAGSGSFPDVRDDRRS